MPNDEGQQANETPQGGNSGQQSATTDFEGLYSTTGNTPGGAGTRQRGGEVVDKPWTQMTAAERQAYLAAANQRK
jgi:hypothetical protein